MKTIITSQRNVAVHILRVLLGLFHCFHFSELADKTFSGGNFIFNQNFPATTVNSYITCKELMGFFSENYRYFIFKITGLAGQF